MAINNTNNPTVVDRIIPIRPSDETHIVNRDVDTDPNPAITAPPTAEHISSHPDATDDTADGATVTTASAAGTHMNITTDATPLAVAAVTHASGALIADAETADTTTGESPVRTPTRKRNRGKISMARRQRRAGVPGASSPPGPGNNTGDGDASTPPENL